MKKNLKTLLITGVVFVLACTTFTGCTKNETKDAASEVTLNGEKIYPVQCEDTLTYWMTLNPTLSTNYTNFGETPLAKELEKKTGIKVQYIHPQTGQETEQFNIMLASDELSDMVQYAWNTYYGGADKAIEEGYILSLNDAFKKYAPALTKYLNENEDVDKSIKTDIGNYYTVPFVRGEEWLTTYQGLILRKDWLEEANKEIPKTLDELEEILKVFKDKYANGAPLVLKTKERNYIMYAHNIGDSFYVDDDVVKYGPAQPEYKDVLVRMRDWYSAGLLDNNMVSADSKYITARVLNSDAGAFFGAVVGGIGEKLNAKPAEVASFDLVAVPQLTVEKTDIPEFSTKISRVVLGQGNAISGRCKNVELAARYLDYGFTEEGNLLYNFGIEGESYNFEDGEPKFSEMMTNNPDKIKFTDLAPRYTRASYNGPFVQDERFIKQSFTYPQQQMDAYEKWSVTNMNTHLLPSVTLLNEEFDEDADIMANVTTYVDEMFVSFVTGKEPIENFDKYIKQLEDFGLNKAISMRQSALERYNNR